MALNSENLEISLEDLNLSEIVMQQLREILASGDITLSDLEGLIDTLPMEVIAQLQAIIEPAAGDTDNPPLQNNRFQDAEAFMVKDMAMNSPDGLSLDQNPSFIQTVQPTNLQNLLANGLEINEQERDSDSRMMKLLSPVQFFKQLEEDPFDFEFRTIDATGNNTHTINLGAFDTAFMTVSGYQYSDGISQPNDVNRPNVRDISNEIFAQNENIFSEVGASNFLWVWGQFLDHDINLTKEAHTESYNINVPTGDQFFDPFFTSQNIISFSRSAGLDGSGDAIGNPRLQVNEITAFIDASNIYGSTLEAEAMLRTEGGKLLMSDDNLLPLFSSDRGLEFASGDVRTNENIALTSMHTIFAREHNHWVDWVASQRPEYSAEKLYQTAKAIVEAEMQIITYNEFLPFLLGNNALPEYQGYNSDVNPQVATEFATVAFRVGHTMLSSDILRLQENGSESEFGHLTLQEAFFRPDIILTQGGIDEALRGLGSSYSQAIDASIIGDVRNFLFGPPGAGGFDLVSLNIQRGRDHGIPDYNTVREAYGLDTLESFSQLTNDAELVAKLTALYDDIDRLDLWVGGLIETVHEDALVGETFYTIIADQFTRLRDGDRFWHENRFDQEFLDIIENTSLSDIIQRNSDITYLQDDIFSAYIRLGGDESNNTLNGSEESDLIIGFDGNDIIDGGAGADALYGGSGQDLFVFTSLDGEIDAIRDFNTGEDQIDISAVIDGAYDPLTDAINDFLRLTQENTDTIISVDRDGAGSIFDFENVVSLQDISPDQPIDIILT